MCRFKVVKRSRCLCLLRNYMRPEDEISKKLFPGLLSHGLLRKSKTNKLERSTTGGRYANRPLLRSFPIDDGKNINTTTLQSSSDTQGQLVVAGKRLNGRRKVKKESRSPWDSSLNRPVPKLPVIGHKDIFCAQSESSSFRVTLALFYLES